MPGIECLSACHALLDSLKLLIACNATIFRNLVSGMQVSVQASKSLLFRSPSITTALLPVLGYNKASELAKFMKTNGVDIFEANTSLNMLPVEKLSVLLLPENLLKLGYTASDLG